MNFFNSSSEYYYELLMKIISNLLRYIYYLFFTNILSENYKKVQFIINFS